MAPTVAHLKKTFSNILRQNPYSGFIGRRLLLYIPFLLPHDKSYHGFKHLAGDGEGLFLDIGANDGISALGFRRVNRNYHILSIEPNLCHERALYKLKKRLPRFDYKLLGGGRTRSEMTLYIPIYNGAPAYSAASLHKDFAIRTMQEHYRMEGFKSVVIVEHKVEIIPLDELELKPDLIKMDTEGFDHEVLLGLVKTIEACRPSILLEYNPDIMEQLAAFFAKRDYCLLTYDHPADVFRPFDPEKAGRSFDEKGVIGNVFCVPKEKAARLPIQQQ